MEEIVEASVERVQMTSAGQRNLYLVGTDITPKALGRETYATTLGFAVIAMQVSRRLAPRLPQDKVFG